MQGILVYDVTSRKSFEALDSWLREASKYGVGEIPLIVCANKCDKMRTVTEQEGAEWAQSRGLRYAHSQPLFPPCPTLLTRLLFAAHRYFETSASSGQNIQEVFDSLFATVVGKLSVGSGNNQK